MNARSSLLRRKPRRDRGSTRPELGVLGLHLQLSRVTAARRRAARNLLPIQMCIFSSGRRAALRWEMMRYGSAFGVDVHAIDVCHRDGGVAVEWTGTSTTEYSVGISAAPHGRAPDRRETSSVSKLVPSRRRAVTDAVSLVSPEVCIDTARRIRTGPTRRMTVEFFETSPVSDPTRHGHYVHRLARGWSHRSVDGPTASRTRCGDADSS